MKVSYKKIFAVALLAAVVVLVGHQFSSSSG